MRLIGTDNISHFTPECLCDPAVILIHRFFVIPPRITEIHRREDSLTDAAHPRRKKMPDNSGFFQKRKGKIFHLSASVSPHFHSAVFSFYIHSDHRILPVKIFGLLHPAVIKRIPYPVHLFSVNGDHIITDRRI